MNELFPPVTEEEANFLQLPRVDHILNQQLNFKGNKEAFARGNLSDFIALMRKGNVIWLNDNILACDGRKQHLELELADGMFTMQVTIRFENYFDLYYVDEPRESDQPIFDMLLDSIGKRRVSLLDIHSNGGPSERQIFSTPALHKFLLGNTALQDFDLNYLQLDADACGILGSIPRRLDCTVATFVMHNDSPMQFKRMFSDPQNLL
jgi:hypothetical protein